MAQLSFKCLLKVIPLQHLLLQLLTLLVLVDGHTMSIIVLFLQALHQLLILTQLIHLQLVHQSWLLTYHPCQKYPIVLVEAMTQEVQWPRRLHHFHHLLHLQQLLFSTTGCGYWDFVESWSFSSFVGHIDGYL